MLQPLLRTISATLFCLLLFADVQAQQHYAKNLLFVKFKDDSGYDERDRQVTGPGKMPAALNNLGYWGKAHRLPKAELDKYRRRAAQNLDRKIYDPSSEFYFHLYDDSRRGEVKQLLASLPDMDYVLDMPMPVKPPVPDYQSSQKYEENQATGINAEAVWTTYSNRGAGIKVCDIEYDYQATHNDLNPVTLLGPTPVDPFNGAGIDHGTAVLGEIGSSDNGWGTTGIASGCQLYFAGVYIDTIYDVGAAILQALPVLSAGDVILLEQQIEGPNWGAGGSGSSQYGLVPVEWFKPYYDAIVLATGQGITVVEAAGNGEQNLDAPEFGTGNNNHYPFLAGHNSGAIIVGAGAVDPTLGGSDNARSMLWYSNYGSRVDVQGNGERVTTTGYGDLYAIDGPDKYFTSNFGGTSGASPIVTGAVTLLQSVYKHVTGGYLSPAQVRIFLRNTGKAQQSGTYDVVNHHIGPLPDVFTAIDVALASGGVAEHAIGDVEVFPNPGTGMFYMKLPATATNAAVTVCDAVGHEVWRTTGPSTTGTVTVDLSGKAPGIYLARIACGDMSVVKRLVVVE